MARNQRIRRTFTPQFKKEAVALLKQGRSATDVAQSLGIARSLLQRWKGPARPEATTRGVPGLWNPYPRGPGGGRAPQEAPPRDRGARHPEKSAGLLRGRRELRFCFMDAHRGEFRIGTMCEVLGISRSGYYAWRRRPRSQRDETDAKLTETIRTIHEESRRIYGSPRVYAALRRRGIVCGRHRVARIMRDEGIRSKTKRRFRYIATKREETPAAPNRLERCFTAVRPNRIWASDITIVKTAEGWLHLAIVLDLFSRKIVGWAMSEAVTQTLALEALQMAFANRRPRAGLVHHSDRGGQYLSAAYQHLLDEHGAVCSMSRPGNCLDNAVVESFFHTLKTELVYQRSTATRTRTDRNASRHSSISLRGLAGPAAAPQPR